MTEKTLTKTYDPGVVEEKWARFWVDEKLATPDSPPEKDTFSMVIPPPNITGALHLGHALNSTLQDVLSRYKRMRGFEVLWLPGMDHAGIATQNVVERELSAEGATRHDLGRERFIERVWEWKEQYGGRIINQLKRLGASCDWTRLRFTMDSGLSRAVRVVFTSLYEEGLIYRGDYIINWCPRCHTALSDLEVDFTEREGSLWYLKYPIKGEPGRALVVATTRPETMLGDTAVAVNPEDERYRDLIGKTIELPLTEREIPVVADSAVSTEFGTGAVKVTPAHDFNDFEIAKRHDLPVINIMDVDARTNENAGRLKGLDRFTARKKVVEEFKELGLLEKVEDYTVTPGACYRCSTVVEPRLSKQWFVKVAPLAEPAIKAVEDGSIRFVPKNWENTYFDWMRNIRDWCISRQIWWGHRIPAWHCEKCAHTTVSTEDPSECEECGSSEIRQDPDVLDTWFSSALWPFSTLGWPDKTPDLKAFYPTSVLSTSFDIIFFWVARMIMMGLKFMDDVPFKDVYIHALIRDAQGQKMSKSKGNVIDPLVMMDKYGTDATRFTLAVLAAQGRDIKLSEDRIEGYRNFCNKLWNLTRFTLMNVEGGEAGLPAPDKLDTSDRWILTRLSECRTQVTEAIESYNFDEAARTLYAFTWHELCDWYVELVKEDLRGDNGPERKATAAGVLVSVLGDTIKMLHPFMPFITEEIYSYLPGESESSLMKAAWPEAGPEFAREAAGMELVMDVVRSVRNVRTDMNVPPGAEVDCLCFSRESALREVLTRNARHVQRLARVADLEVKESGERPADAVSALAGSGEDAGAPPVEVFVPLKGHIDFDVEIKRLEGELDKAASEINRFEKKLANENFVEKAPVEVVEKERARLEAALETREKIQKNLDRIRSVKG